MRVSIKSLKYKHTFISREMVRGNIAFEVFSPDLHPVIHVFQLIRILEDQRGMSPLIYHIHVGVVHELGDTKIICEVANVDGPLTVMLVQFGQNPNVDVRITSQLMWSQLQIAKNANIKFAQRQANPSAKIPLVEPNEVLIPGVREEITFSDYTNLWPDMVLMVKGLVGVSSHQSTFVGYVT